jgi:hypothetical protein
MASVAQNTTNQSMRSTNSSGYRGVSWCKEKRRWKAQIMVGGKTLFLGRYDTREDAHAIYADAARRHHGEFVGVLEDDSIQG